MANIKFGVSSFVCCIFLAQFNQIVCDDSEKCDRNAIACDQNVIPIITKNASKSTKTNTSSHSNRQMYQSLDSLMMQDHSNYESSKYKNSCIPFARRIVECRRKLHEFYGVAQCFVRSRRKQKF